MDPHMGNHGNGTDVARVTSHFRKVNVRVLPTGRDKEQSSWDSRVKVTEPTSNRRSKMARVAFCVWDTCEGIQASPRPGSTCRHSSQGLGTHHLSFLDFLYRSLLPLSFFRSEG